MFLSQNNKNLIINPELCKGCGICVAFCPKQVLAMENEKVKAVDIEKCIKCGLCELRCPDYAIYIGGNEDEK
ncbi:4Fe-4S binding protein [Wukongibacter sp. M2B1]